MAINEVYQSFQLEINPLFILDQKNQETLGTTTNQKQLHLINEAIFTQSFRGLENFIQTVFIEYVMGSTTIHGDNVTSYLTPLNNEHAYDLIKSSQPFLEWNSPDILIKRSEVYLDNGFPVKLVISSNKSKIEDFKKIRNHIAHNSKESLVAFKKVLTRHYSTIPLAIPSPGKFLQEQSKVDKRHTLLREYLNSISDIAEALVSQKP
jgi:hypothetical protein